MVRRTMINRTEQIQKLYEDAVAYHLLSLGYPEDRARTEAVRIAKSKTIL